MKKIINPKKIDWQKIIARPSLNYKQFDSVVSEIFDDVLVHGDKALKKYTAKYDEVAIEDFKVDEKKIFDSKNKLSDNLKEAIKIARINIEKFHLSQQTEKKVIETTNGVECWIENRPIEKIGLYIPGGSAPLFSTVLMLAIPAVIAGCKEIAICTPPNKYGEINPAILFSANLIGIKNIFSVGGIQSIAAMTFGTESIPKVYKIFGPGNNYVTAAKRASVNHGVAIDMPAGPSELLVLADKSANPSFIAADLLSQAEHGDDSQVICITNDLNLINKIEDQIDMQISFLPRKETAKKALDNSRLIYFEKQNNIIDFINEYAPEHLIISVQKESENFYLQKLINAGSVFIGKYSPESAGDYASGTNHTLPTSGFAKTYSGINLDSFVKKIQFQKISKKGICNIGPIIETMAYAEGLQAHKNAITIRLKSIEHEAD